MSKQTIESHDIAVDKLFSDFYVVPSYQREYVWEEAEVDQLLNDIYAEMEGVSEHYQPEYFIGSIVVCRGPNSVFEVIDGQQRMTTLYVLLCVIRDCLKEIDAAVPEPLGFLISSMDVDYKGETTHRYRLNLQYDDSCNILHAIASYELKDLAELWKKTRSVTNILSARDTCTSFLTARCGEDPAKFRQFYAYLTKNVKLIRIETSSLAHALKVFETINDRGVGLDSMDLLKNLLFMKTDQRQFDTLKKKWKELVDTLYHAKEKPLRFLRYFVMANYKTEKIKEDELYNWLVKSEAQIGYASDPLGFADTLLDAARAHAHYITGKNRDGSSNRYLQNIASLSGKASQHVILLLAAKRLPPDQFTRLCKEIENLFFAYIIVREPTKAFEHVFGEWAGELRGIDTSEGLTEFLAARFEKAKQGLLQRFVAAMMALDASKLQQYRLRYVLAKLSQAIDEPAYGSESGYDSLAVYINSKVHVEHIYPQSPSLEATAEFEGGENAADHIQRLGNLCLLETPLNTHAGNKPYSKKRTVYAQSKFLLTKSISVDPSIGQNTSVSRAVAGLTQNMYWNPAGVDARQGELTQLALRVWGMGGGGQS